VVNLKMKKKRQFLTRIATYLLAVAPVLIETQWSTVFIGEPVIPKHYKK